jgi:hypothetical protein
MVSSGAQPSQSPMLTVIKRIFVALIGFSAFAAFMWMVLDWQADRLQERYRQQREQRSERRESPRDTALQFILSEQR